MASANNLARVKNAENLARLLKKLPKEIQAPIAKTFENGAKRTAKRASKTVVKRTGELANSIEARQVEKDAFRWAIFANFYWIFVEFGTKYTSKQPFFMEHYRKLKKALKNSIKRNIKKKLKEYGKR